MKRFCGAQGRRKAAALAGWLAVALAAGLTGTPVAGTPVLSAPVAGTPVVGAPPAAAGIELRDDAGRTLRLPRPARRIVALAPSLTELVFEAGAGQALVGVGRFSNHPPHAQQLPVVSDAFTVNLEAIARLQPDLILVWRSGTPARQRERLRALGVPVFESEIGHVAAMAATLETIGRAAGTEAVARARADVVRQRWAALAAAHQGRRPVRVFVQLWGQPLMTVNRGHLMHEAIAACGGVNVFADLPPLTPTVGWDAAVRADPQLVVGSRGDLPELRRQWQRFPRVSAVRRGQLLGLEPDAFTRMTPRFVDAAQALCDAIEGARRP